ncbi:hypothetical protein BHM03_00060451 [Ensete ventricosum]|nr:hypothetical protein BHM03_00060451 [Ensete ventricosum]
MGRVSYEYGYRVALTHFQERYPKLEIKDNPYTTIPEDDNVSMDEEVPCDDSDPLTIGKPYQKYHMCSEKQNKKISHVGQIVM